MWPIFASHRCIARSPISASCAKRSMSCWSRINNCLQNLRSRHSQPSAERYSFFESFIVFTLTERKNNKRRNREYHAAAGGISQYTDHRASPIIGECLEGLWPPMLTEALG